ncbi:hypothetical protein [Azospirillum lipoferum]|uniref:hypothetical protein n=1 Tax=Azospirillum lipoferum TaxID=193 RepID=UPI001396511B|nr:hypothetical protein [Azospirillum lipoferum]
MERLKPDETGFAAPFTVASGEPAITGASALPGRTGEYRFGRVLARRRMERLKPDETDFAAPFTVASGDLKTMESPFADQQRQDMQRASMRESKSLFSITSPSGR